MSAIVINNLNKKVGKKRVFTDLNLEILDGEFFSLLGTKDSGKTTLLKILAGFLKPNKGSVTIYDMNSFKDSKEIKESVSFIPEDFLYQGNERAIVLLKKTLNYHNLKSTEDAETLSDYFNFNMHARIQDMNDREKKLFSIINALIVKPRLLILDNPNTFLEHSDIEKLFDYIVKLNKTENMTILLLGNNLSDAKRFSKRIAYLHDGRVQNIEYNNEKPAGDKILRISSYRGNLNYFTEIGCKVIKDSEDETILYYDNELSKLSKVIYEEQLLNYNLESASLEDKIKANFIVDDTPVNITDKKDLDLDKKEIKTESPISSDTTDTKIDLNINTDENTIEDVKESETVENSEIMEKLNEIHIDNTSDTLVNAKITEDNENTKTFDDTIISFEDSKKSSSFDIEKEETK